MISNKRIGSAFEREMCDVLAKRGYWVHFMSPDNRGAQPFDLIFVKNGEAFVADCKTCDRPYLRLDRLEDNQIMAFDRWLSCGNRMPLLFVKYDEKVYRIRYDILKFFKKIDLREQKPYVF